MERTTPEHWLYQPDPQGYELPFDLMCRVAQLEEENEKLRTLVYRDSLTGLRNRRYFTERLEEEVLRTARTGGELSIISIDVNGFKCLNDSRGHSAGDSALLAVARLLESSLRAEDLVCRVGGDEFIVLMPQIDERGAQITANRLRKLSTALMAVGLDSRPLSFGVAARVEGDSEFSLMSRADARMYEDKAACRKAR